MTPPIGNLDEATRSWRVVNALGSGAAFLIIGACFTSWARAEGVGHRTLLWIAAVTFTLRSVANFVGAWYVYRHGSTGWDVWLFLACMISSCVLAASGMAAFEDVLRTLRTTETAQTQRNQKAEFLRREMELDYQSMRNMREYASEQLLTRGASEERRDKS